MRYKLETLVHAQCIVAQYFEPSSVDLHHPYIAIYVRRSDKVKNKEMSQAYTLNNISIYLMLMLDEQILEQFILILKMNKYSMSLLRSTKKNTIIINC